MQFKYRYIDKIPTGEKHEDLNKGIILHDVFDKFYDYFDGNNINEAMFNAANKLNIPEEFQLKYENHAKSFMEMNELDSFKTPLLREKKYFLNNIRWSGIIDRVDCIDGKNYVLDYKTSKGTSLKQYKDELLLYAYMVQIKEIITIHGVGIIFTGSDTRVLEEVTQEEILDNFEMMSMERDEYEDMIKNQMYEYKPGFHCRWCDYKGICKIKNGYKEE